MPVDFVFIHTRTNILGTSMNTSNLPAMGRIIKPLSENYYSQNIVNVLFSSKKNYSHTTKYVSALNHLQWVGNP